jgi:hypothetical protein
MKRSRKSVETAAQKISKTLDVAKVARLANMIKIYAPGNGDIIEVGYRDKKLTYYATHEPLDTRFQRQGEYTSWFLKGTTWVAWGWFNAWDETQYLPTETCKVSLSGGGHGKVYRVPKEISSLSQLDVIEDKDI